MTTQTNGARANARVRAALAGEPPVDRVPFIFWHHFKPEGSGERMAGLTQEFFVQKFNLDIVKIMPDLPYPDPDPQVVQAGRWEQLPRLDLETPMFREQLVCIRTLRERLGPEYPLILTLFSPLTSIMRWIGRRETLGTQNKAVAQIRQDLEAIVPGLEIVADNLRDLMRAAIEAGASGIFFSCMGATNAHFTREEYARIGRPYDLRALEGAQGGWLNIVHVHADPDQQGNEIYFEDFTNYPVAAMSWSDRVTGPSLSEALTMTDKCLMGGLDERGPITHGSEQEIKNEMLSAVSQTQGRRLILANGCSIPDDTSEEWLHTARRLVDNLT